MDPSVCVCLQQVIGEDVSVVNVVFDHGWAKVFISHDNDEILGVSEVVENPSLEHQQVRIDTALAEVFFKMCKKVLHAGLQHVWDHGFGSLPVTGKVELRIVVCLLW
jgi:hypothetical protein